MRLIVIGILVVLALLTILVPLFKKRKPSLFTATVLLIPAIALGYFEHVWVEKQEKLETAFRTMTNVGGAKFSCDRMSAEWFDALISVQSAPSGRGSVTMKYSNCASLMSYQASENKNSVVIDNSLTESVHAFAAAGYGMLNPGADSERVRCSALRNIPNAVAALGGSAQQGYMIQEYYKSNIQNAKLKSRSC